MDKHAWVEYDGKNGVNHENQNELEEVFKLINYDKYAYNWEMLFCTILIIMI